MASVEDFSSFEIGLQQEIVEEVVVEENVTQEITAAVTSETLQNETEQAVEELGLDCSLEKVTDIMQITSYGVMMTPALVVDGEVKVSGKVPSLDDLKKMLG